MMFKNILVATTLLISSGCATSNYTVGSDFQSENVSQIQENKTTAEELVNMFGEPYAKSVLSSTQEKWIYMYTKGQAKATSYIVAMDVETTGTQKRLEVFLDNKVVTNYTFTEGQNPYNMSVN